MGTLMKIGYFCNTTNWKKKPYTEILNNARDIATIATKIIGILFGLPSIILTMREWSLAQIH